MIGPGRKEIGDLDGKNRDLEEQIRGSRRKDEGDLDEMIRGPRRKGGDLDRD